MDSQRTQFYGERLAQMIRVETVSALNQTDTQIFYKLHALLKELFPHLFAVCQYEHFDGSFLLYWKGSSDRAPIMLMNHHDVVEASGDWTYPPFSGTIADGKIWGRGTIDTKSGLFSMLQAADELAQAGFVPPRDTYFLSACTEETDGSGAERISRELVDRGLRFAFVLDEGGTILHEPISGAKGTYAIVGLGEKGCADIKFIARSKGGHASTPPKNTPLIRLGKFMAAVENSTIFKADMSPVLFNMFGKLSATMAQPLKYILGHAKLFKPLLLKVIPSVSEMAGAMLKTTLAFTMAGGSEGTNVLPQEAWVIGNMRFSHHQGGEGSFEAVRKLAKKYDIEMEIMDPGFASPLSDPDSDAFRLVEKAVSTVFPGVITTPYLMTGASDCRFMSRVSEHCLRFAPFKLSAAQLDSIHAIDENLDLDALAPAVDFYKYILTEA